ncbi:sigma-70 family RNA polymerase sigma factor [Gemmata sp. JC717]|uniref:sigma-70 family RNA polymerase sigma factor n=1 Tax=Gemmata algarum TaxID=2975278 RepID=UPI0021BB94B0|nr:sigma-70 family RNA polymerase sigma factor [Gemmata algarum]MDY3556027.1 sigma-70 family RNA polymerase sigma factor [Gemmata algarum]
MNTVLQLLDAVAGAGARTDGQLLDSFARRRDQGAFAELVHRHGAMVLGVCRRVLGNAADADDAFQAVFLVLARKAAAVRDRERLGPWLHGVAFNAARRLKRANLRRTARERGRAGQLEQTAAAADESAELHAVLDEELARLPDRYRSVLVLCDLEGRTRKEAAHALGCPEGTVGGRLARARELLAARLGARGVCPALGALAGALVPVGAGAVAPALVAALVRAVGVDELARDAARGPISSHVSELAEGVVSSMFAIKLQKVTAVVLCCGLALACAAGGVRLANAQPEPEFTPVPLLTEDPALQRLREEEARRQAELEERARGQALEEAVPRRAAIVPLRKLDSGEVAPVLAKFFDPGRVTIAALPGDKSLLVYADEKTHAKIRELLLQMGEPAPRNVTALRLNKTADLADTVKTLTAAFGAERAVFVPVPVGQVLLVYASESDTQTVKKLLAKVLLPEPAWAEPAWAAQVVFKTVTLKNLLPEDAGAVVRAQFGGVSMFALPPNPQLILYGPADVVEAALKVVTALDEGGTAKTFEMQFQKAAWSDVLDWYAKVSGLVMITTAKPTGTFTFAAPKPGQRYTLADVTDIINETLMQQKLLLVPRHMTFFIQPSGEKIDPTLLPRITLDELPKRGRTEIVEVLIPLRTGEAAEIKEELTKLLTPFGTIRYAKDRSLIVADTAGNVARIVSTLGDIERERAKRERERSEAPASGETAGTPRWLIPPASGAPVWVEKVYRFNFKPGSSWTEVFEAYEKATGLKGTYKAKPTGTFTRLTPAVSHTLAEFTDIINDALLADRWLLIRREGTFVVVPADEKIDSSLVPRVAPEGLSRLGRTELVQVIVPVPTGAAEELVPAVKKRLGPFGSVTPLHRVDALLVQDVAENALEVCKIFGVPTDPKR